MNAQPSVSNSAAISGHAPMHSTNQASQHTPGPWSFEPFRTTADTWLIERRDSGRKSFIAEAHCSLGHGGSAQANARLIAAAPELLAALEAIANSDNWCGGAYKGEIVRVARAAIARATQS